MAKSWLNSVLTYDLSQTNVKSVSVKFHSMFGFSVFIFKAPVSGNTHVQTLQQPHHAYQFNSLSFGPLGVWVER